MSELFDKIWKDLEMVKVTNAIKPITLCTNCDSVDLVNDNDSVICKYCGLVLSNHITLSSYSFEESVDYIKRGNVNNKITKMQKWMEWQRNVCFSG